MTSDVAFIDGERPAVIKRCRDPVYLEWLVREHRVLRALAGSPLSIPRVLGYAEVTRERNREAWLVMSRLDGHSLWDEMLHASAGRRAPLLRRLGALLRELHTTPVPASLRLEPSWIDRMLDAARENLAWSDGTPELLADLHRRRPAPFPEVLIHGDLALDNVLINADDTMSLIDWSGGGQGDPRYDIALALQTEPEVALGDIERAAFFEGYAGVPPDPATRDWFVALYEFF
jgi:aminoglycoside phosphotransferase (APT) family kinase protein